MTGQSRTRTANAVGLTLGAAAVVVAVAAFLLLAYVDANLQRGGWRWAVEGWTVGVAVLALLALVAAIWAFNRARYLLAWTFVLAPLGAAVIWQLGLL